jgi:hypothetical protein
MAGRINGLSPLDTELLGARLKEECRILSLKEWKRCEASLKGLRNASLRATRNNIQFNAIHWAFDVFRLLREIIFGITWMNAHATLYKKRVRPQSGPAHVDLFVSYFADNCVTRIDSCRNKLALMVWAFYVPFNPEERSEVLDYRKVLERFICPLKFGLRIKSHSGFLSSLETLHNEDFRRLEKYRHLKIHRREPRIEMYGVEPHHDLPYLLPLIDKNEILRWRASLHRQYPHMKTGELQRIEKGCHIDGVLFDQRRLKDRVWGFEAIKKHIENSLDALLSASASCFQILRRRLHGVKRR